MTRPDRDKHITLRKSNIESRFMKNYEKRNYSSSRYYDEWSGEGDLDPKRTPYDINSVMHYGTHDGAKNPNESVFTTNFDDPDYDGQDLPLPPPEDPMTVIDQVELLLGYKAEANCTIGEHL